MLCATLIVRCAAMQVQCIACVSLGKSSFGTTSVPLGVPTSVLVFSTPIVRFGMLTNNPLVRVFGFKQIFQFCHGLNLILDSILGNFLEKSTMAWHWLLPVLALGLALTAPAAGEQQGAKKCDICKDIVKKFHQGEETTAKSIHFRWAVI